MRFGWGCLTNESSKSLIVIDENDHYPEPVTLMQFTGLRDKNGREIYEGDVIEKKQGDKRFRYDVRFSNGSFGIEFPPPSYLWRAFCDLPRDNYEVIGNIYENPELLK
ncbi:YopX family protein [Bradyrhizobium sp. CCGUVB23]|nr:MULTISPECIES: YopX family protein [unclassified Bradyrhizobium]MCP3462944.1 YopX family protein [Bradyrhizobium sp. CCGUVB23]